MSQETCNNLIFKVASFFQYVRYIFKIDANEDIKCIPFFHSNPSSLESHFSEMRAQGADAPKKYVVGIVNYDYQKSSVSLSVQSNSKHTNEVDEDEEHFGFLDLIPKHAVLKKNEIDIIKV